MQRRSVILEFTRFKWDTAIMQKPGNRLKTIDQGTIDQLLEKYRNVGDPIPPGATLIRDESHLLRGDEPKNPLVTILEFCAALGRLYPFPIAFGIPIGRELAGVVQICRIDSTPIGALPRPSEIGSAKFPLSLPPLRTA
jgi:hypothetical protein